MSGSNSKTFGFFSCLKSALRDNSESDQRIAAYPLLFRHEVLQRYNGSFLPFYRTDDNGLSKTVSFNCHVRAEPKKTEVIWQLKGLTIDSDGWLRITLGEFLEGLGNAPEEQEYWKCFLVKRG